MMNKQKRKCKNIDIYITLGKIKVQHVSLLSRMRLKLPSVVKNSLSEGQTHLYVHGSKPC